jgi:hypothetical protein
MAGGEEEALVETREKGHQCTIPYWIAIMKSKVQTPCKD